MSNDRDTKFAGFARLLTQDLIDQELIEDRVEFPEAIVDLIAQRAYDLAYHVLSNTSQAMAAYCEHRPDIARELNRGIPDLTEWPAQEP